MQMTKTYNILQLLMAELPGLFVVHLALLKTCFFQILGVKFELSQPFAYRQLLNSIRSREQL